MGDPLVWDDRYRRGEHASSRPAPLFEQVVATLPPGRALDLACGAGRHSIALANLGWDVVAVDGSRVAIDLVRERAVLAGRVQTVCADLERGEYVPEPDAFDLVCVFYYLNRGLVPAIRAAIRPGGHAACAIHVAGQASAKLLSPGELRGFFLEWQVIIDRERDHDPDAGDRHHHGTAELFVRRPR